MNVFPFIDIDETISVETNAPLAREYSYDFVKGDFNLRDGKPYIVEGDEAIKVWIHKALITSRYKEVIHTWSYGSEHMDKLIGKGYSSAFSKSEAERYTRDSIEASLSDYVTDLKDFNVTFDDGLLTIEFTATTIYGEVNVSV